MIRFSAAVLFLVTTEHQRWESCVLPSVSVRTRTVNQQSGCEIRQKNTKKHSDMRLLENQGILDATLVMRWPVVTQSGQNVAEFWPGVVRTLLAAAVIKKQNWTSLRQQSSLGRPQYSLTAVLLTKWQEKLNSCHWRLQMSVFEAEMCSKTNPCQQNFLIGIGWLADPASHDRDPDHSLPSGKGINPPRRQNPRRHEHKAWKSAPHQVPSSP